MAFFDDPDWIARNTPAGIAAKAAADAALLKQWQANSSPYTGTGGGAPIAAASSMPVPAPVAPTASSPLEQAYWDMMAKEKEAIHAQTFGPGGYSSGAPVPERFSGLGAYQNFDPIAGSQWNADQSGTTAYTVDVGGKQYIYMPKEGSEMTGGRFDTNLDPYLSQLGGTLVNAPGGATGGYGTASEGQTGYLFEADPATGGIRTPTGEIVPPSAFRDLSSYTPGQGVGKENWQSALTMASMALAPIGGALAFGAPAGSAGAIGGAATTGAGIAGIGSQGDPKAMALGALTAGLGSAFAPGATATTGSQMVPVTSGGNTYTMGLTQGQLAQAAASGGYLPGIGQVPQAYLPGATSVGGLAGLGGAAAEQQPGALDTLTDAANAAPPMPGSTTDPSSLNYVMPGADAVSSGATGGILGEGAAGAGGLYDVMPGADAASSGATGGIAAEGAATGGLGSLGDLGKKVGSWALANPSKAVGMLGALGGLLGGSEGQHFDATGGAGGGGGGGGGGGKQLPVLPAMNRTQTPFTGDYNTYGQNTAPGGGGQWNFFGTRRRGGSIAPLTHLGIQHKRNSRFLRGPTGGQEDTVPIDASHGEYVIDASTVSDLGDGNNEAGASALDQLVAQVRGQKRTSGKRLPPKAKPPLEYLRGRR